MKPSQLWARAKRHYWTRRLQRAIRKGCVENARRAIDGGAPLDGWKSKGPILFLSASSGGIQLSAVGALEMAWHWLNSPPMFQFLLEAGATIDTTPCTVQEMVAEADTLDHLDHSQRYESWIHRNGATVAGMIQAAKQSRALEHATPGAATAGSARRL